MKVYCVVLSLNFGNYAPLQGVYKSKSNAFKAAMVFVKKWNAKRERDISDSYWWCEGDDCSGSIEVVTKEII